MTTFDVTQIRKFLESLKKLPKIKEKSALQKRLQKELQRLKKTSISTRPSKEEKRIRAQKMRSGKMRRYHNYVRQIRNNYSGYSYNQIRKQLSERRKGNQVSIPDVVWQDPSG
ncbi:MAG: hypothetical protein ABI342_07175 [Nitrososphaera sp.]|jgi:DNA polymerase/3'-5' exonuclease PolX